MSEPVENLEPPDPTPIPTPLEAAVDPDSCAAWTVTVTPGSATAKVLALLDPTRLSQAGRVDALVGLERLVAWAQAEQTRVLAAMADDRFPGAVAPSLERSWVKEDVRAALGESSLGANARLREAENLVHERPATLAALGQGLIRIGHARAVAEMVCTLDPGAARQVEAAVLPRAEDLDPEAPMPVMASFRRKLRREVAKADPRTAEQKAARAIENRDVWVMPDENAMGLLGARLPAEGAETVYSAVSARADADKTPDDARTKAQRRADALVGICTDYLNRGVKIENDTPGTGSLPRYHGLRPAVQVSVALSTLLGLDEQPGELDGHGPIPAGVARRIAADPSGTWRRLVTDELGRLVDYGRSTYRPPADLAQYVVARDRTCRAPGCNQPAVKADLHHIRPWSQGGETNADGLAAACEHDHYSVHEGGWQIRRLEDGTVEWTSPTGHAYRVPPATYPIDTTTQHTAEGEDQTDHTPGTRGPADDGQGEDQSDHGDEPADDEPPF
jgi:hypothetical protein